MEPLASADWSANASVEKADRKPLIPDGEYEAEVEQSEVYRDIFSGGKKLALHMRVFCDKEDPEAFEMLARHYNYAIPPSPSSDYYREWVKANGGSLPLRKDRWFPRIFMGKRFLVRIVTVDRDRDRDPLEGDLRYSKVAKILRVIGPAREKEEEDDAVPF